MKPEILLIGSDPELIRAMEDTGHTVHQTRSPHNAIDMLESRSIRLIIADLDPCGPNLLDALELCRHGVPMIAVSSLGVEYITPLLRQHRECIGLGKPVDTTVLREAISRQLKSPAAAN